jgi:hypothetical protein
MTSSGYLRVSSTTEAHMPCRLALDRDLAHTVQMAKQERFDADAGCLSFCSLRLGPFSSKPVSARNPLTNSF